MTQDPSAVRAAITEIENDGEFVFLEPAAQDAAIVGIVAAFGQEPVVCYDRDTVIDMLVADGMSRVEAEGFFATSIQGTEEGDDGDDEDGAPVFLISTKALLAKQKVSAIRDAINEIDGKFLLMEPATMDAALVGLVTARGKEPVTCYDRDSVIDILMGDGMDRDEAEEFFSFNIEGAYMGPETPVFMTSAKNLLERM